MAEVDAQIPLSGRQFKPIDPLESAANVMTLAQLSRRLAGQGAYVIDPQTGEVKVAETRRNLAAISPEMAMKFDQEQNLNTMHMLTASRLNQDAQRRSDMAQMKANQMRAQAVQGVLRQSLGAYYTALQSNGGDEQAAQQAGDQAYKAGFAQLAATPGMLGTAAIKQGAQPFNPEHAHQVLDMSDAQWMKASEHLGSDAQEGDPEAEQGGGAGAGSVVPAAFIQGSAGPAAPGGGGFVQSAGVPAAPSVGLPQQSAPVAPPEAPAGYAAGATPDQAGGEFVQTAGAKAPAFTQQDVNALPDTAPAAGSLGKNYNWQRAYQFTRLTDPKINTATSKIVYDYRTGQPIQNEPVIQGSMRVASAGRSTINAAGGDISLGQKGTNDIDAQLVNNSGRMSRLKSIMDSYEPDFQTLSGKLTANLSALKEQFLGGKLDPAAKANLEQFSTFRRRAYEDFNQTLKFLSGTAVSAQEFERVKRGMPNPGEGLFDGDSPTEFTSKLRDSYAMVRMAQARLMYFKKNGMPASDESWNKVPLDAMPNIMRKRADEMTVAAKKQFPSATPADINKMIKPQLAEEFGLQ